MRRAGYVYLIGIHMLLAAVFLKPGLLDPVRTKLLGPGDGPPLAAEIRKRIIQTHASVDGNVPPGSAVFLGDSHVMGLLCSRIYHPAVNYGVGTDSTQGVVERIGNYAAVKNAAVVVVAVGFADIIGRRDNSAILDNYRLMAERVPPEVPVVFNAIFPIDERVFGIELNEAIGELNEALAAWCEEHDRIFFCDATEQMKDADGNLRGPLNTGDGLHLSSAGNEIWISALTAVVSDALEFANREAEARASARQ